MFTKYCVCFRSCVGSRSCSWCRLDSRGNNLNSKYCTSSSKCYWGIEGNSIAGPDKGNIGAGAIVGILVGVTIVAIIAGVIFFKFRKSSSKPPGGRGSQSQPAQPPPPTAGQAYYVQSGGYSNPAMTPSYPPEQEMHPTASLPSYPNPPPTAPDAPPAYGDVVNTYPTKH